MTREEQRRRHDLMREYKAEGHTMSEVAEKFEVSEATVNKICKGIAPQRAEPSVYRNQYTNGKFNREENAIRYINERTPNFEYAGNFTGIDGKVDLRCKECGTVMTRSFITVRHSNVKCRVCEKRKAEERIAKQEALTKEKQRQKELNRKIAQIEFRKCIRCENLFVSDHGRKYCSKECMLNAQNAVAKDKRIKKMRAVIVDRGITLKGLYERDKGICHLCGGLCDWNDYEIRDTGAFIARDFYPSIDHVEPLSKGGNHSWANVKLAHRKCNYERGDTSLSA